MQQIKVSKVFHRNQSVFVLQFPYNEELINICKSIHARFTKTFKGWWLPESKENLDVLFKVFKDKAWLDVSALKKNVEVSGSSSFNKEQSKLKDLVPENFKALLKRRRYSESTYNTYCSLFNLFLNYFHPRNTEDLTEDDIRTFQDYLVNVKKVSISTQNQYINAIKFYYEMVMGGERKVYYIERPRKEEKLPVILSEEEVLRLLKATANPKHRMAFALLYATGMRSGEIINLRVQDIDLDRRVVHIRNAKGKKDRISILSKSLIPVLEHYIQSYKPDVWLLESPTKTQYTANSLRVVMRKSLQVAGIKKNVSLHGLRHAFATHLLESGTDIRYLQELLGHNTPKTTAIYTHVSNKSLQNIESPLDKILNDQKHLKS